MTQPKLLPVEEFVQWIRVVYNSFTRKYLYSLSNSVIHGGD